jgi:hypothetical protein
VRLSHGDYVSGTLDVRSNTRLEVGKVDRLLGSVRLADYPPRIAARRTMLDIATGVTQSARPGQLPRGPGKRSVR